ncbi:hypothetical protein PSHT_13077 [Puccinia striiformis]|uniref:Heme haloperoxidase family profile domain-containing protein n=1 Tax=Puccinia striiformis TaxID=27350 RepID=A0A2S4UST5_9BASI|nr:hypothetical protein PSHT_13077 [Puccinia striiformis]
MLPQIAKYKAEIPRKSYDLRIAKHLPVERDHMDSSRKEPFGGSEAPQWIQEWSRWDGLLPDGHWPSVDRNMDLSLVSRSPCPGLNALANHGIINKSGENLSFHRMPLESVGLTTSVQP